ncbi:MAG: PAS domain S-box protein [Bradyrhizobium sp.]|nr:PAS domain S-box protein [Bradyrhizobium sp.]
MAIILVPAVVLGGWIVSRSAVSEQEQIERKAQSKVRQTLADIDREIDTGIAMLSALASSRFLQVDDFQAFRQQVTDVAKQLDVQIVLADAKNGQQIVNTSIAKGDTLPRDIPKEASDARQESIRGVKPTISNVYYGPISKRFIINVGIPIVRDGLIVYYLSAGVPASIFADAVSNAATPSQWIVSVVDRETNVIARSERQDEVVGTKSHNEITADAETMEGVGSGVGRFGVAYSWVWQRSARTGWIVSVAVPRNELEAPRVRALMAYTGVAGSVFAFTMVLTFYIGGQISKAVGEMGIDREPTREEFRILFEHNPNGVLVLDDTGQIVMANVRIEHYFGYLHDELIGQPVGTLVPGRLRGNEFASP